MSNRQKFVVYQVFTRLFGNTCTANVPWGTLEENGVGKFGDFTPKALRAIRELGVTHIWYTGVPHHAMVTDYSDFGIEADHPQVVKGRAGSPYAVKDYYNVNPDLAADPARRLEEFQALVRRTHEAGMKVVIDIVPNHVARKYEGASTPKGRRPLGADDDITQVFSPENDFYYLPGEAFQVPEWRNGYRPLGGKPDPALEVPYREIPAKWTGNGSRQARPDMDDWYETVKVNYGVAPDGAHAFDTLPGDYRGKAHGEHLAFWKEREVPPSWVKFRGIALYWLDLGVGGFRYDMAEMVPVEFWSYLNSNIKNQNPEAFLMAEVYDPRKYRDYIGLGKMDYLYDKVELYDSLKHIVKGYGWTDHIPVVVGDQLGIESHLLRFLENHDEHRIAAPEFAGDPDLARPAMVVTATLGPAPVLVYFGQEVGEPAAEHAGFGSPGRTSIFDYIGVPNHQRWMNGGKFDGGELQPKEQALRDFHKRLLNFTIGSKALTGAFRDIHYYNKEHTEGYDHRIYSFVRWQGKDRVLIACNFEAGRTYRVDLKLPPEIVAEWGLKSGTHDLREMLYCTRPGTLRITRGQGSVLLELDPMESVIFKLAE